MTSESVLEIENKIDAQLKALPPSEFTYYLSLLVASLKDNSEYNEEGKRKTLLNATLQLIINLSLLYTDTVPIEDTLQQINNSVNQLTDMFSLNSISYKTKKALCGVLGAIAGLIVGLIFSAMGLAAGLWDIKSLRGAGLGFVSGFAIGLLIGYRSPTKLLERTLHTQLDFCIRNIKRLETRLPKQKTMETYKNEVKEYIMEQFFDKGSDAENDGNYNAFLTAEQEFQICTTTAGHISRKLKGYLGHHALIKYKIDRTYCSDKERLIETPIEFGDRKKMPRSVQQEERRIVTGEKLVEMLALDSMLQETHGSLRDIIGIYTIGSDDCRTYVDKILMGTGQEPAQITRFTTKDKKIAQRAVGPLIAFFSHTVPDPFGVSERGGVVLHEWRPEQVDETVAPL